jgi:hypothetical protein
MFREGQLKKTTVPSLASDVYAIDAGDTAVTGQIAINTPANADVALLDLYGWDGTSWVFVPSEYDPTTQQRRSANHALFQAVALGQADPPDNMTVGGVWSEKAGAWPEEFTEAIVSVVRLGPDGELEGALAEGPADLAIPYLELTNMGNEIKSEALAALLAEEALQKRQQ